MPKLAPHELGALDSLVCRRAGCGRNVATNGSGYMLPFCPDDLRRLSRKTFDALSAAAGDSVFDVEGVARATAMVAHARLELSAKLRKKRAKRA